MKSIRKSVGGRHRLRTYAAIATAVGVAGTFVAITIPAHAALQDSYNTPTIRTSSEALSVYVTGTGFANWRVGQDSGQVGSAGASVSLDVCYTYVNGNNGDFTKADEFYAYVNQAPGVQGPKPVDSKKPETVQFASPLFEIGTTVTAISFASADCTNNLLKQVKKIPVKSAGSEAEAGFDLDLAP